MAVEGVRRPAWAEISASALAHNLHALKSVVGDTSVCAVVKADAYGHGAVEVATLALENGADSLAVALVDEGMELRDAGITAPILILAEIPAETIADALDLSLTLTIGSIEGAKAAIGEAASARRPACVHVKVDTGMHRMGVAVDQVDEVVDLLRSSGFVDLEGFYTHLSVADGSSADDRAFTREQIRLFDETVAHLESRGVCPRVLHLANSAGALGYPEARRSMVRLGLSMYGYLPQAWLGAALGEQGLMLRPVMTLRTQVIATRRVGTGSRPSYGRRRVVERDTTIVTVPFGYADGYPRRLLEAGAEVLIRGQRYPLAGTVTMDQIVIDVGDDVVTTGEDVILLGTQGEGAITADEWARLGGTIAWEILCGVDARVPRVLVD